MEVKVAKTAGFCFGVQRAVDKVYELIGSCPDMIGPRVKSLSGQLSISSYTLSTARCTPKQKPAVFATFTSMVYSTLSL